MSPELFGGAEGIRTPDLIRARDAFSQLNYCPIAFSSREGSQVGEPCSPPLRPDFQSGLLSPSLGGSPIITPLFIILPSAFAPLKPPKWENHVLPPCVPIFNRDCYPPLQEALPLSHPYLLYYRRLSLREIVTNIFTQTKVCGYIIS